MFNLSNFNALSTFEKTATVAFYLTLAFFAIGIIIYALTAKFKHELIPSFRKTTIGMAIGYALSMIVLLGYLKLSEYVSAGYIDAKTFYPILAFLLTIIIFAIAGIIVSIFKKERFSLFAKIATSVIGAFAIALFIAYSVISNTLSLSTSNFAMLYIFTIAIVATIVLPVIFIGKKTDNAMHTKSIVYAALSIALSFALSYIRFFELPSGGSITFASLAPIMIYAYMFGSRRGVLAGAIYGILQFIQAPWFVHPIQFLLDYPIAFSAIGLCGIIKELGFLKNKQVLQFAIGAVLAVTIRYLSHVISGIFIWGSGDPANYGAVAWSFLYNSFTFVDLAIALAAGCLLFASKSFMRQLESVTFMSKRKKDKCENNNAIEFENLSENAKQNTAENAKQNQVAPIENLNVETEPKSSNAMQQND